MIKCEQPDANSERDSVLPSSFCGGREEGRNRRTRRREKGEREMLLLDLHGNEASEACNL
jgi:hypothetical protein